MRLHHLVGSFQRFHQFPEAYESPLVNPLHVNPEMLPVARVAQDLIKLEDLMGEKMTKAFHQRQTGSFATFSCRSGETRRRLTL